VKVGLDLLAGVLGGHLQPLRRTGQGLRGTFEELEGPLRVLHRLQHPLLVEAQGIARRLRQLVLAPQHVRLPFLHRLHRGGLDLGVAPHALFRSAGGEVDELTEELLVRVRPVN